VLASLYLTYKYLPAWLINVVLSGYITLIGSISCHHVCAPAANALAGRALRERRVRLPTIPAIPWLLDEPTTLEYTLPELLLWAPSIGLGLWYTATKHWVANNYLGICFSLVGIQNVALGSVQIAAILLAGLFVYDVFWVFCTPVMVSVARNFEAPIKLVFPREALVSWRALLGGGGGSAGAAAGAAAASKANFAMLGLGDIVIPGFWVALLLRYDVGHGFATAYFQTVFWAYVAGLVTTIGVMNFFKAAQPALLYIVPAVLLAVAGYAALRGEVAKLWHWHEDDTLTESQKAARAARAGGDGSGEGGSRQEGKKQQ
jgi:minor histocompatibility antigen H13